MRPVKVGMHQAKSSLSQLVREAAKGTDVVISSNGKPVARLVAYPREPRIPGLLAGQIVVKAGFEDIPEGLDAFAA